MPRCPDRLPPGAMASDVPVAAPADTRFAYAGLMRYADRTTTAGYAAAAMLARRLVGAAGCGRLAFDPHWSLRRRDS